MSEVDEFFDEFDPVPSIEHDQEAEEGQSPSYEPNDDDDDGGEMEIEQESDQRFSQPGPSRPRGRSKPGASTDHPVIPSNGFAPAYDCPLLARLSAARPLPRPVSEHFAHVNCFHLTRPHTRAPATLVELKQHAQAVCLLLSVLQPSADKKAWPNVAANPAFPPQFDFLTDLNDPYPGQHAESLRRKPGHHKPLAGLTNTLESDHGGLHNIERCTKAELISYANKLLTRLDHLYRSTGGILSIPPPPSPPETADEFHRHADSSPHDSILAQWLYYTRALTLRLASLEREIAALREVMGHEALVANVRGKQARARTANGYGGGERELVFPQDRYVLAGLSDGLWARLHEELTVQENQDRNERNEAREERKQGRGVQRRGWGDFGVSEGADDDETKVVTWIETTSRLYRIRGHETIFVIPGFGLHPGAPAVHRVERTPLVQSVPERRVIGGDYSNVGATAWERDVAARAADRDARIETLESAVVQLKRELETEKTQRRRLVEEAELKGRRAALGHNRT
ncbi:hypothetical protein MMC07_004980 [Pseudocyphellaria aurata]|nr:hypothetical protein [Pseudocyphellaria aurata]